MRIYVLRPGQSAGLYRNPDDIAEPQRPHAVAGPGSVSVADS